jgi:hypothetical protein
MSTVTYVSTNSRPCASCHQVRNCLNTCPDRDPMVPSVMVFGEIALPDGTMYLYPAETPRFLEVPPADIVTVSGVVRAFDKEPQSHAKGRTSLPRVPVGAVALIVLGLTLMAIGFLMNEPLAWLIYGVIHG